ncbi:MAG: hypothetical protein JSS96_08990 [Bacteroidetes bacterium]|nr:hypothetical protein [Bacteroidota bacterium]
MRSGFTILLVLLLPLYSMAQHKSHVTHKHHSHTSTTPKSLPTWASAHNYTGNAHAYFPDYYTFYDANRGGYVFWDHDKWTFTPTMPPYLQNKDLAKSRVQILKGLSLDLQPQQNYPRYMKLYPPVPGAATDVPVPTSAP